MTAPTSTRTRSLSIVLACACLFWLSACGGTSTDEPTEATPSEPAAQNAGGHGAAEQPRPPEGKKDPAGRGDVGPTGDGGQPQPRSAPAKSGSADDREAAAQGPSKEGRKGSSAAAGASPASQASHPDHEAVGAEDPGGETPEQLVVPNSTATSPGATSEAETPEAMSAK